jgi:hypothetical protein
VQNIGEGLYIPDELWYDTSALTTSAQAGGSRSARMTELEADLSADGALGEESAA